MTKPLSLYVLVMVLWIWSGPASLAEPGTRPPAGHTRAALATPAFALTDTSGLRRSLAEFRGRPVALFFLCGCTRCQRCAAQWGRFQVGGVLAPAAPGSVPPVTVVVFGGDAASARTFAARTGLMAGQTVLLPDPDLRVTEGLYHVPDCPRAFALDARGATRYAGGPAGNAPDAPLVIASRAMEALRGGGTALAPRLAATTPGGRAIDLSAVPGWRVVYFWSASCPCVSACERYSFAPLAEEYRGRVAFFAVASDGWDLAMPRRQLLAGIAARRLPYPVLLDTTHSVALGLGARVTPQTFVLDPQGRVVFRGMPDDSRRFLTAPGPDGRRVAHTYLSVALAQALAGRPVTASPLPEAGCIVSW